MIMENVLLAAEPYLRDRKISDLIVGISLIGCQLDNGNIGVSYVLRGELPHGCSSFPFVKEAIGKPAWDIAKLSISTGDNNMQRSVAASVLAAAACQQDLPRDDIKDMPFGIEFNKTDTLCMIGFIRPLALQMSKMVKKIIIFDKGLSLRGENLDVYPMEKQRELIPACDIVLISGTATINGSIDSLLELCKNARHVVIVGPSTPMFPKGWRNSCVSVLAGSCWNRKHKEDIFRLISLASGIKQVKGYMLKKAVTVYIKC